MKKIAIIGAGGFGREVKMLIDQINENKVVYEFMGYYDDNISKGSNVNGFKVLGAVDELTIIDYTLEVIISIADPRIKKKIYKTLKFNSLLNFPSLIHPNVLIGKDEVIIGYGCIICASNIITVNIVIGNFVANRGPLFYVQERIGKNGHLFKIIKYRTMVKNAEKNCDLCSNAALTKGWCSTSAAI